MSRMAREVSTHLNKARESALLAVETYNRPGTRFRSGGFVVLMCIAWTALFHAIFFRRKIKPFYRKKENSRHFQIVEGDRKSWELSTCLGQYFGENIPPERKNVEFFIGLRNKIEHRSMPALDMNIFGECQAFLFNFEDLLTQEFGEKYALNESLSLALQFSCVRSKDQDQAIRKLHRPLAKNVSSYVENFRSALSAEQIGDPHFSYKVFLIPKPANHQRSADVAVEFVKFDPSKPEEMEKYQRLVSLIKPSSITISKESPLVVGTDGVSTRIRVVSNGDAIAVAKIDYDESHPHRGKDLLLLVNKRLGGTTFLNSHDLKVIRRIHKIDADPNLYHQGKFGPPQYSEAFADWLVDKYRNDTKFFASARAAYYASTH